MKTAQDILYDLIKIKTEPKIKDNSAFITYATSFLSKNKISFTLIKNPNENLSNIIAGINVQKMQDINNGIILSGHMDTVDASLTNWKHNPFQPLLQDGCIYGLGAVDMKYFIAVILSLLPKIKQIQIPVFLTLSCDEETNVSGIQEIIKFLSKRNIHPQYALIGEATDFKLCVSNRGCIGFRTTIKGISAHAGKPEQGINAIYIGAKLASKIEELSKNYASVGTTLNVGTLNGGIGRNSIPANVYIDWEIRYKNNHDQIKIINEVNLFCQELKKQYKNADINTETKEMLPSFEEKENSTITKSAESILKTAKVDFPYASEAGFFQAYGADTLICGAGDTKQAHAANEHIKIADINKYADFLLALLQKLEKKPE